MDVSRHHSVDALRGSDAAAVHYAGEGPLEVPR